MNQKMTREEARAAANEMQGSRDAQKNLGRKQIRIEIKPAKREAGRKTKR